MIYILIQIDNISFVYRNKVCHFRKIPGLSGQCNNSLAVVIILLLINDSRRIIFTFLILVRKNNDLLQNYELFKQKVDIKTVISYR